MHPTTSHNVVKMSMGQQTLGNDHTKFLHQSKEGRLLGAVGHAWIEDGG
jgi:hypothetical protein